MSHVCFKNEDIIKKMSEVKGDNTFNYPFVLNNFLFVKHRAPFKTLLLLFLTDSAILCIELFNESCSVWDLNQCATFLVPVPNIVGGTTGVLGENQP